EASVDLAAQQVTLGKVRGETLDAWATREADGQLDWQKLFSTPPAPKAAAEPAVDEPDAAATADAADLPPSATNTAGAQEPTSPAADQAPAKPWQILVTDVQLSDYRLHLRDEIPGEPVDLLVGPFSMGLQKFDSLGTSPFQLKLDSGIGKQGRLAVSGSVLLDPISAQLKITSKDVDLRLAQAYLAPFVRIELRSGLLASDLAFNLQSA